MQVSAVKSALKEVPEETKDNVEKKQARTYEEIQAEKAEQELVSLTHLFLSVLSNNETLLNPYNKLYLDINQVYDVDMDFNS